MQNDVLMRHLELVLHANEKTNITSIKSREEGSIFHIQDSLLALPELEGVQEGSLVDIGSGAGYPGIPLAIESGRKTLLVDSVKKKAAILIDIVKDLGLENVEVYAGRIEDLSRERPSEFSVVTARALAQLSILMELASPLLHEGGYLISYKAQMSNQELEHALSLQTILGMKYMTDRTISLKDRTRRIITFKKIANSKTPLP